MMTIEGDVEGTIIRANCVGGMLIRARQRGGSSPNLESVERYGHCEIAGFLPAGLAIFFWIILEMEAPPRTSGGGNLRLLYGWNLRFVKSDE